MKVALFGNAAILSALSFLSATVADSTTYEGHSSLISNSPQSSALSKLGHISYSERTIFTTSTITDTYPNSASAICPQALGCGINIPSSSAPYESGFDQHSTLEASTLLSSTTTTSETDESSDTEPPLELQPDHDALGPRWRYTGTRGPFSTTKPTAFIPPHDRPPSDTGLAAPVPPPPPISPPTLHSMPSEVAQLSVSVSTRTIWSVWQVITHTRTVTETEREMKTIDESSSTTPMATESMTPLPPLTLKVTVVIEEVVVIVVREMVKEIEVAEERSDMIVVTYSRLW